MPSAFVQVGGHFVNLFEFVSSAIFLPLGLLTAFVYGRILAHHLRTGFHTHYQKLFIVCATNDILAHYSLAVRVRLTTWGINEWYYYIQTGYLQNVIAFLNAFSIVFQIIGTCIVAVNRASSLAAPHNYEKLWKRHTWHVCLVGFLVSALFAYPMLAKNCYLDRISWGYYMPLCTAGTTFSNFISAYYFPVCLTFIAVSAVLNVYTCAKLYKHTQYMDRSLNKSEKAFHAVTICQFCFQLLNTVDLIITNTQSYDEFWFFFEFQPMFADLASFLPIWVFACISEEMRGVVFSRAPKFSSSSFVSPKAVHSYHVPVL